MTTVNKYRCRHTVEAMRWFDTDENRETFATWFDTHDTVFETRGPVVVLPDEMGEVIEGDWILRFPSVDGSPGDWVVREDEMFREEYEVIDG